MQQVRLDVVRGGEARGPDKELSGGGQASSDKSKNDITVILYVFK